MKRTAIIILGAALVLSSCGKSEIPVYDLKDSAVSFKQITNNFSLRGMTEPERELVVEVSLIGPVSDVDRPISYRISGGDAIEGTDFTVVSAMVPAGSIAGSIVLNVKKLPEGTSSRSVSFTIEPNDSFREGFSSFLTANVTWTDSYERPTLYVWRYWHLYLSKGYSRAWNQFLVSIYGDEVELYTCSRTYATDNPSLIYNTDLVVLNQQRAGGNHPHPRPRQPRQSLPPQQRL